MSSLDPLLTPNKGSLQEVLREHPRRLYTHPFNWTPGHLELISCKTQQLPPYLDNQIPDQNAIEQICVSNSSDWLYVQKCPKLVPGCYNLVGSDYGMRRLFPVLLNAVTGAKSRRYGCIRSLKLYVQSSTTNFGLF